MKTKICESRLIRWASSLKLCRFMLKIPIVSRFMNYEMITYLIVGVITTVINYAVYFLMPRFGTSGLDVVVATWVAWVFAVLFAFFANKIFVFDSPSWKKETVLKELIPFVAARLLSLGFDSLFTYVTIGRLHLNEPVMKILSNIFVLIANYLASKFVIFKKGAASENTAAVPEEHHES